MGLAARAGLSAEEQLDPAEGSDSVCLSDGQLLLKGCLPDLTLSLMFGPGNGSSSIFTGAGGYALSVDASGFDAGFFLGASGSESGSVAGFFWLGVAGCRWVSLGVAGSVWLLRYY